MFWKPSPAPADNEPAAPSEAAVSAWMLSPVLALAAMTILLGIFMDPVFRFAETAALQLLEPRHYVAAVLGGVP